MPRTAFSMNEELILVGFGGHAHVLLDIINLHPHLFCIGYVDKLKKEKNHFGLEYFGDDEHFFSKKNNLDKKLINALVMKENCTLRKNIYVSYKNHGYSFASLIHPSAIISECSHIQGGVQVCAGSIIQAQASIEANTIVNTGSIIEHDVLIGEHCHVAPGAVICGFSKIGNCVFIGANATVLPGISICDDVTIGAGAVVNKDITLPGKYVGVPAEKL